MNWWYKIEDILGLESTRPMEEELETIIEQEHEEEIAAISAAGEEDEDEIIAVITAAIAAISGKKPTLDFRVVSFKKRGNWNKQAYI